MTVCQSGVNKPGSVAFSNNGATGDDGPKKSMIDSAKQLSPGTPRTQPQIHDHWYAVARVSSVKQVCLRGVYVYNLNFESGELQ